MSSNLLAGSHTVPTGQMLWEKRGIWEAERPGKRREACVRGWEWEARLTVVFNSLQILLGFFPKGPCLCLSYQLQAGIADPQHLSQLRLSKTVKELT